MEDLDAEIEKLEAALAATRKKRDEGAAAKKERMDALAAELKELLGGFRFLVFAEGFATEADLALARDILKEARRMFDDQRLSAKNPSAAVTLPNVSSTIAATVPAGGKRGSKPKGVASMGMGHVRRFGPDKWRFQVRFKGASIAGVPRDSIEDAMADRDAWRRENLDNQPYSEPADAAPLCDWPGCKAPTRDGRCHGEHRLPPSNTQDVAPMVPESSQERAGEPLAIPASNPNYVNPGAAWGPVDDAGLAPHLMCRGTGRIPEVDRKGAKHHVLCGGCQGEGLKRCVPRAGVFKPGLARLASASGGRS